MRTLRDPESVSEDYSNRIFLAERNNGINKLSDQSKSILNPVLNLDSLTNASKLQLCDRYYFTATCNYDITSCRAIFIYTEDSPNKHMYTVGVAFSRGVQRVTELGMHACHKCAGVRAA